MTVEVKGLSDLKAFMDALPAKLQNNVMRGALTAGARVVAVQAKQNCPVGMPSSKNQKLYGGYKGALRDSIRVSSKIDKAGMKVIAKVVAGGKTKRGADVWYAHMIEYTGAVAHRIIAKKGHALFFGSVFAESLEHPGFHAKPFLRPALDALQGQAVVAVGEYVKQRLSTKNGIDTAGVVVELV